MENAFKAKDLPDHKDFKDSLVAFIDILGFNNRVKTISDEVDFIEIGRLLYAIRLTADRFTRENGLFRNYKMISISDSLIITVPFSDQICTYGMLALLHNIQYELLFAFKTTIRGYINRGYVYHENGIIFGSGYSDAYDGQENNIGGAPRIVLSPAVVKDAQRVIDENLWGAKESALSFLREDNDGYHYIDYLNPIGIQAELSKNQLAKEREAIKKIIEECLIKHQSDFKIFPKYAWLKNYFELTKGYYA